MHDKIYFQNEIAYMVVGPHGDIQDKGILKNAVGWRMKDQIMRGITGVDGASPGTLVSIQRMAFRADGSTILGSLEQYVLSTAYSTRYNNATYVTSVNFNGTFSATANTTIRAVVLGDSIIPLAPTSALVGTYMMFYSTSFNLSVGSAGAIVISWTISN